MYELHETSDLTAPVLVAAFEGWAGAGSVGITAAAHIAGDGPVIASFPPDLLYDYRVSRPKAIFIEGALQDIAWPSVTVKHRAIDGRDLLVISGRSPRCTNGVNRCSSISSGTPSPSSATTIRYPGPSGAPSTWMFEPPWSRALETRLRRI